MTSGKQAKRLRREPRANVPPPVRGQRGARQASPRVLIGAGAALAAAAVAIVLAVTLTGGKSKPPTVTADLSSVSGIPQNALLLGSPTASVTLTEYVDMACPVCQDYVLNTFPTLAHQYVRTGKVKMEARVVSFVGPSSSTGRDLVLAAARQNKAWQMLELLYQNQGNERDSWLTDDLARAIAAKIPGLDVAQLLEDADSDSVQSEGVEMDQEMQSDSVSGTPTFFLTTRDGKRHFLTTGTYPPSAFAEKLDQALNG